MVAGAGRADFSTLTLGERLRAFAERVVVPLRALRGKEALSAFTLLGKQFWPLRDLDTLLAHVHVVPEARGWDAAQPLLEAPRALSDAASSHAFYMDARRCHECDGLVLTPNERGVRPFTCSREAQRPGTYKWKFAARHSVDLAARHAPLRLCCLTDAGECELTRQLGREARRVLARLPEGTIVECRYDGAAGTWCLDKNCVRTKRAPNHLAVVVQTLLASAEHLTLEELRTHVHEALAEALAQQQLEHASAVDNDFVKVDDGDDDADTTAVLHAARGQENGNGNASDSYVPGENDDFDAATARALRTKVHASRRRNIVVGDVHHTMMYSSSSSSSSSAAAAASHSVPHREARASAVSLDEGSTGVHVRGKRTHEAYAAAATPPAAPRRRRTLAYVAE
jgi:hypothetical protein